MTPFKALAVDFDGTIAQDSVVSLATRAALRAIRSDGVALLLVTGRITAELRAVLPDVDELFDAVVAEDGAVLVVDGETQDLAIPVSALLADRLRTRGVEVRQGRVMLACSAVSDQIVFEEIRALGLDEQLVRNRSELMVLPAGVSKAGGSLRALARLGLNRHNLAAVGDAQNDHALLELSQLSLAVANAVPALRDRADVVLERPDGAGIEEMVRDLRLGGSCGTPVRHQIVLGTAEDGRTVRVDPFRHHLVAGGTHSGKSYVTGLLVEHLLEQGYVVLVVDAEGDHTHLDRLPNVVTINGSVLAHDAVAPAALVGRHLLSCVIDLSDLPTSGRQEVVARMVPHVDAVRARSGIPHVVVYDEAHLFTADAIGGDQLVGLPGGGTCLATFVPGALSPSVRACLDTAILRPFATDDPRDSHVAAVAEIAALDPQLLVDELERLGPGEVVLLDRHRPGEMLKVLLPPRSTPHVRHQHKYAEQPVEEHRAFVMCEFDGDRSGVAVRTIDELGRQLHRCSSDALVHHSRRGDFSLWAADSFGDRPLVEAISRGEALVRDHSRLERGRATMVEAIESRYLL